MAAYDHDYNRGRAKETEIEQRYNQQQPKIISLADEVRGLQNQCNSLREDMERLNMLLAETREGLALLSQRTFGQEPSR